jgi:hypothetical protein
MTKLCECCNQPGELARFPAPVALGGISELMMCEACCDGNPLERFLEYVAVPKGIIKLAGVDTQGRKVWRSMDKRWQPN